MRKPTGLLAEEREKLERLGMNPEEWEYIKCNVDKQCDILRHKKTGELFELPWKLKKG